MNYLKFLAIIYLFLISTLGLSATTYEDGEDKGVKKWKILEPSLNAKITNKYDKSRETNVIRLEGKGTKNAYRLFSYDGASWENKKERILHWQMKYSEDFVIIIGMDTSAGKRYLIYTPGESNGYMQIGLGKDIRNGQWQRLSRNLQDDLDQFERGNRIVSVNSFVIRGSGMLDNIKLMSKLLSEKELKSKREVKTKEKSTKDVKKKNPIKKIKKYLKKKIVKKSHKHKKISVKKTKRKSNTNSTPVLHIKGDNPYYLMKGEPFEDPGATAKDKEDGKLEVTISGSIDIHKKGKYNVMYMATDRQGNSAIDSRYIEVSDVAYDDSEVEEEENHAPERKSNEASEEEEEIIIDEEELTEIEEKEDAEFRLEERELEISEWEKELELREKEIAQREQHMQNSMEVQDEMQY